VRRKKIKIYTLVEEKRREEKREGECLSSSSLLSSSFCSLLLLHPLSPLPPLHHTHPLSNSAMAVLTPAFKRRPSVSSVACFVSNNDGKANAGERITDTPEKYNEIIY
jgi:hypothetical protein